MDSIYYINIFKKAEAQLNKQLLDKKQVKSAVGIYFESIFLKLYKTTWANKADDPLLSESRIFFSVWINDESTKHHTLFYNIHALKLRQLNGYKIASRDFATDFRKRFKPFEHAWPNVSIAFGPQTLMEGFVTIDLDSLQNKITELANAFLQIDYLIDDLLNERKILSR